MGFMGKRMAEAAIATAVVVPLSLGAFAPQTYAQEPVPSPTGTFGPDCSELPKSGEGSAATMAKQKVADAAAGSRQLAQLSSALTKARLDNTLNQSNNITLFAPTNHAFNSLSEAQRDSLLNDPDQLKKVLTYHVVDDNITPGQLPNGSFKTLEGSELTTSGSGTSYKVNDVADVVCGNVTTANATVYFIDALLTPPD
ncbi:fasciclin domain-containing protein [Streptomyces sp. NBC_01619]|uniref:Fasciclin domain-containing protein n=1 Tax=Streptomyces pratisoli TaxID=3139917 RepID=A0ACC6QBF7_9ACTN|nr:fasciclin domain-containing protein [Streptomyces sp. NBC_01619]MCX4510647.1 fasciclin domain-containing protein [Streptomyces sp. NBC_01619]